VRAKHLGKDLLAGAQNMVGGELRGYTELLQEAREQALGRMLERGPRSWRQRRSQRALFD
jgi:uncharacterized protein YbjQ (UPF0145 family)